MRSRQKYCSIACKNQALARASRQSFSRTCAFCGKTFEVRSKREDRKTCPECRKTPHIGIKILEKQGKLAEAGAEGARALAKRKGPTSAEKQVSEVLQTLGVNYETQKKFGRYIVDFFLPDYNLVVEADGEYWHKLRDSSIEKNDKRKDLYLKSMGLRVIRVIQDAQTKQLKAQSVRKLKRAIEPV